jgi:hypothetical protein
LQPPLGKSLPTPAGTLAGPATGSAGARPSFEHRFDMGAYRDRQAEQGHDRRVVDQESLLSESVNTNMILAERLEGLREAEGRGQRRGDMMRTLAQVAPLLTDSTGDILPRGTMTRLLEGCGRARGSLLLMGSNPEVMDEHDVVPPGSADSLNAVRDAALGSLALRLCRQTGTSHLIDDVANELFFNDVPPSALDVAAVLTVPLTCDGVKLGALFIYGRMDEPTFDDTEQEFWTTAAHLVGLSLHWHTLRKKLQLQLQQTVAS